MYICIYYNVIWILVSGNFNIIYANCKLFSNFLLFYYYNN